MSGSYQLNVHIEINRRNEMGGHTGDRLSIQEDLRLDISTFMEIAQVLGRFHELAERIKAEPEAATMSAAAGVDQAEPTSRLVLSEESEGTGRVLWSRTIG